MGNPIVCHDVSVAFRMADGRENQVLRNVRAEFPAGQTSLVCGRTGAGKSTLLHVLAGLKRPTEGEVRIGDRNVSRWISAHRDRWRRQVGIVFQLHHLLRGLSVLENVLVPMIPRDFPIRRSRRRALDLLAKLDMSHLRNENIRSLSGGERQRVAIARALVSRPAFLLADEPTAHQDRQGAAAVLRVLAEAREWDAVIVVAAHDLRVWESEPSGRRYRLENGALKEKT
jgi:ABC-type lipoprotein export system ATPase subunit